jgi:hypothetical protein
VSRSRTLSSALAAACLSLATAARADVNVTVDPSLDRRPINPLIYGVNFASSTQLSSVDYPLNRWGGNAVTRYNWRTDVSNRGSDWFFMNIAGGSSSTLPDGSSADQFIDTTLQNGAEAILTVPTIGWTPKEVLLPGGGINYPASRQKRWGFSVSLYGQQLITGPAWGEPTPDAGNGTCDPPGSMPAHCQAVPATSTTFGHIVGNNPQDTSQAIGPSFVTDWVNHLVSRVGTANGNGVAFYALDNEPMLWNSTHRDVHPTPLSYDGLWTATQPIAAAVKAADPGAKVLGPDSWGWCDLWTSAADAAVGPSCVDGADRQAHGGVPLLEWYLDKVCDYEEANGVRLVDYLDVHFYPQGNCVPGLGQSCQGAAAETAAVATLRFNSLKELYDPDWNSESWIGQFDARPVKLVPRLRAFRDTVQARCPGIGLALTEYKWGTDDGITSALAQAEALAIFGREGLDLGTRWGVPGSGTPAEDAYRLFLDLDPAPGVQSIAGESVRARSSVCDPTAPANSRPCNVGSYAVRGATGELWVLLFNHDTTDNVVHVSFVGTVNGPAALFQFNPAAAAGSRITSAGSATVAQLGAGITVSARTAKVVKVGLPVGGLPFADGFELGGLSRWLKFP